MKQFSNLFICIVLMLNIPFVSAQELTSKKGIPILPKAGDIAIGISATPLLDFAGNMTKINSNNVFASDAAWNYPNAMQAIYLKYFLTDKLAVRARLRINNASTTKTAYSVKNLNPADSNNNTLQVEDKWVQSATNVYLSLGLEKRRGYGRLQGFYGAELTLGLSGGQTDKYTYGNAIDSDHQFPNRTNFNGNVLSSGYITERKTKPVFGAGIGAFVGAEYFILPKISVGGEFGWNLGFNLTNSSGDSQTTLEYWASPPGSPSSPPALQSMSLKAGKTHVFSVDNSQTAGNLFLLLHF